jgi:hypothetical protein
VANKRSKRSRNHKNGAPRSRAFSLLGHYGKLPKINRTIAVSIEHPYSQSAHTVVSRARQSGMSLVPPPGRATITDGAPKEWRSPGRPQIEVLASTRDVIAGMFARRQIDEAMFGAARKYQWLYERARSLASVRSVDLEMPPIEGLRSDGLMAAAAALAATDELKRLEAALERHLGESGLFLGP